MPTATHRPNRRRRDERGSVTIQMVFLMPALFLLTNLACASFYELLESPARAWIVARWGRRD